MTPGPLPEVVAHRGANEDEPEHSLASYLVAVKQGADAVECDVRLTADGTLVLVHDRRINRTSSGQGTVSRMTLEQLSAYDFSGSQVWRDLEDPAPDESRTSVLTLHAMIAAVLDASPRMKFAIETKHPTRYGKYVEEELVRVLEHFGLTRPRSNGQPRVRLMSFSRTAVQRMSALVPQVPTVFLMDRIRPGWRDGSLPRGTHIVGLSVERLHDSPDYVERVLARGNQVHVWTVDDPRDVRLCVRMGVSAIISNRPAMVRAVLASAAG